MRPSFLPLLFGVALLSACSDSATDTEQQSKAPTQTKVISRPDTAAEPNGVPKPTPAAKPQPLASAPDTAYVQNAAAYLAGLKPATDSGLIRLAAQPAWQAFAKDQDKSWAKYRHTHTDKMNRWAATELDSVRQNSPTVFYPFSGPDFLNVFTLFPASQTYVMVGLEPVGSVPARAALADPKLYPAVKTSLWSVLNFSFFRTNDMAVDLKSVHLDGAVPLIMLFAARTGNRLQVVRPVWLDAEGRLADAALASDSKAIPGAEMKMQAPDGTERTAYYFSADLSDYKLGTKDALLRYVRTLGPVTTYVKSATYLMHKSYFSKIRNLVLEQSRYVLQDDSGIAMKYFAPAKWQFTYYGTYRRPINLFAKHYQPALTAAYRDTLNGPRPLPFGTGYNWRQTDSNLLLARRKN